MCDWLPAMICSLSFFFGLTRKLYLANWDSGLGRAESAGIQSGHLSGTDAPALVMVILLSWFMLETAPAFYDVYNFRLLSRRSAGGQSGVMRIFWPNFDQNLPILLNTRGPGLRAARVAGGGSRTGGGNKDDYQRWLPFLESCFAYADFFSSENSADKISSLLVHTVVTRFYTKGIYKQSVCEL